jgi:phosphoglucosamine mutase
VKGRLFGTDGMRGVALRPPLDAATVTALGAALAAHLGEAGRPVRILLAGDTRSSTPVLAGWLGGAFAAAGGEVVWAGVLPTPAVSQLVREAGSFGSGVVVSASHNPAADNGIKLVSERGTKWPESDERSLEQRVRSIARPPRPRALGRLDTTLAETYLCALQRTLPSRPLSGLRIVVDAANGAASPVAETFFRRLGAAVEVINASPNGSNINSACGSLHPGKLVHRVTASGADAGVALDGDADRALLVSAAGRVLDGDDVLLIWGRALAAARRLPGSVVVATVMSNLGLEVALGRQAIRLVRCPVGDREVWDAMEREGAALGGEQSGHVICAHHAVTGDGLLTAAHVLAVVRAGGVPLDTLADLERYPQVLRNVRVAQRIPLAEVPALTRAIAAVERRLAGSGRVLVRYSGTEPLLRIMVEAATDEQAHAAVDELTAAAKQHLGEAK